MTAETTFDSVSELTDQSHSFFFILNSEHRYLWGNKSLCTFLGLTLDQLIDKHDRDLFGSTFYEKAKNHYFRAFSKKSAEGEIQFTMKNKPFFFHISTTQITMKNGLLALLVQATDFSELLEVKDALFSSEHRFNQLYNHMMEGCCVIAQGAIIKANKNALTFLGIEKSKDCLGEHINHLLKNNANDNIYANLTELKNTQPNKTLEVYSTFTHKTQSILNAYLKSIPLYGTQAELLFLSVITPPNTSAPKLVDFNSLTGLYNRQGYIKKLNQFVQRRANVVMFYLDIDNFKNIIDSLGYHVGDKVLQETAQRLKKHFNHYVSIIGHFGGDEFSLMIDLDSIVVNDELDDKRALIDKITAELLNTLKQPFDLFYFKKYLSCSIGRICFPQSDNDARSLIQNADTAMHEAKKQGRNRLVDFDPLMNKEVRMQLWLEVELQKALNNNSLEVWYQPKVNAKDFSINGAEALVRWKHPIEGYISPAKFIPIAECSGVIEQLGQDVMRKVFQSVRRWHQLKILPGRVAINLSPEQFNNSLLIQQMQRLLQETRTPADLITFELTETAVMNHGDEAIEMLNAIKKLGFHLSIDDFGTGYSSLSYLAKFPLDELKIDRAFIMNMEKYPKQVTLIENIINLGNSLNMSVVAEGVETATQAQVLRYLKCNSIQGFHFHKPMPADEFEALLNRQQVTIQRVS